MAEGKDKKADYEDFHLQYDAQYNIDATKGHKHWIEKELITEIHDKFQESARYRVLSVGSGTGCPDVAFLEVLSKLVKDQGLKNQSIVYTVVEPDPKAVEICKAALEKVSRDLNIEIRYQVVPSEKYLLELEEEFELILFVHVLSWLKEYEKILARCFERMTVKGGTVAVVELHMKTVGGEGDSECHEGDCGGNDGEDAKEGRGVWSVEVDAIAEKRKWKFKKFPNQIRIDLTEISKDTEKGKKQAKSWMHMRGEDVLNLNEKEYAKCRDDFLKSVSSEEIKGEIQYFYPLDEMVYFLKKEC